jgi:hypothetical protein
MRNGKKNYENHLAHSENCKECVSIIIRNQKRTLKKLDVRVWNGLCDLGKCQCQNLVNKVMNVQGISWPAKWSSNA